MSIEPNQKKTLRGCNVDDHSLVPASTDKTHYHFHHSPPVDVGEWWDAQWNSSQGSYQLFHGKMGSIIGAGYQQLIWLQFRGWAGTLIFDVSLWHLDWRQCARLLARSCSYSLYWSVCCYAYVGSWIDWLIDGLGHERISATVMVSRPKMQ